jgi:hypothetical protein
MSGRDGSNPRPNIQPHLAEFRRRLANGRIVVAFVRRDVYASIYPQPLVTYPQPVLFPQLEHV